MKFDLIIYSFITIIFSCSPGKDNTYTSWKVTGGSGENIRYSTLDQIDTVNVKQLRVAWEYHSMDADTVHHSEIQCNPIIVDGVMFGTSPMLKLLALEAATGQVKWIFNPHESKSTDDISKALANNNNRGVTYWEEGNEKRIFYSVGSYLLAIDAITGQLIPSFGKNGKVELHEGLGRDVSDLYVSSTSPGIIYKDLLILGCRVAEDGNAAPGHIRAYDVRTGQQRWSFHTIPWPGEFGYETWEDTAAYKHVGGANAWTGFSLDDKRGMLFVPTGSASADFYGGMRKGATLFANCVLALEAATGKYIWHFQTVHHDVWDMDNPSAPSLVTIMKDGKKIDAVAQATKTGFVFVLERETGKPVFPIEERPVSTETKLIGEKLWPTQPIPTLPKPFARQGMTLDDLNDQLPASSYEDIKKRFLSYKTGPLYTPPSFEGTIFNPGTQGGAEWGGCAFDPKTNILYVNAIERPSIITSVEVKIRTPENENYLAAGQRLYVQKCMACHGTDRKGSANIPSLEGVEKKYDKNSFAELLATGRRLMPAFKDLTGEETSAIASFILDLKKEQKNPFKQAPVAVDPYRNVPYTITGYHRFTSQEGYPAIKMPWGTLNAVNLSSGEIEWKIPLGEFPEFKAKGIISGTPNFGGPVVTANGLIFIASTHDGKFRAFHKKTGKLLWETNLPTSAFATPSVYEANGKQFVVIACGGGKFNTRSGDSYVAFALP